MPSTAMHLIAGRWEASGVTGFSLVRQSPLKDAKGEGGGSRPHLLTRVLPISNPWEALNRKVTQGHSCSPSHTNRGDAGRWLKRLPEIFMWEEPLVTTTSYTHRKWFLRWNFLAFKKNTEKPSFRIFLQVPPEIGFYYIKLTGIWIFEYDYQHTRGNEQASLNIKGRHLG